MHWRANVYFMTKTRKDQSVVGAKVCQCANVYFMPMMNHLLGINGADALTCHRLFPTVCSLLMKTSIWFLWNKLSIILQCIEVSCWRLLQKTLVVVLYWRFLYTFLVSYWRLLLKTLVSYSNFFHRLTRSLLLKISIFFINHFFYKFFFLLKILFY